MQIQLEPSPDFIDAIRAAVREEVTTMLATSSNMDSQLMTVADTAEFMQVSAQTVRHFLNKGLPHFKSHQVIRLLKSDVVAWMKENPGYVESKRRHP